jgi:DNA-binding ferritin-like protein
MKKSLQECLASCVQCALIYAAVAHHWHLRTTSYAQHKAFGQLYDYMHDAADKLSEAAMGANFPPPPDTKCSIEFSDPLKAIAEIEGFIKELQGLNLAATAAKREWLANIAQEIQGSLCAILYKLKRLS